MQFISENTSIPIPQVHAIHTTRDNEIFIEMEYVEGETLEIAWKAEGRFSQDQKSAVLGTEVEQTHSSSYRTCFAYANLVPRNIIVREGRVAAIIDWGFAGCYPEY